MVIHNQSLEIPYAVIAKQRKHRRGLITLFIFCLGGLLAALVAGWLTRMYPQSGGFLGNFFMCSLGLCVPPTLLINAVWRRCARREFLERCQQLDQKIQCIEQENEILCQMFPHYVAIRGAIEAMRYIRGYEETVWLQGQVSRELKALEPIVARADPDIRQAHKQYQTHVCEALENFKSYFP